MVDANLGLGFRVPVGSSLGWYDAAKVGCRRADHDPRIANGLDGVPRHHDFGGGVLAELQVQAANWSGTAARLAGPSAVCTLLQLGEPELGAVHYQKSRW